MRIAPLLLLAWAGFAGAHEVHHVVEASGAVVVKLSYADGKPFAYEKYELYPEAQEVPAQVGNSDAMGRVVFVPGEAKHWRLKAFSADGHGVDLKFEAPAMQIAVASSAGDSGPNRASLVLFGLSLILGGFGLYRLFLKRSSS
jgi:nickel transport protein